MKKVLSVASECVPLIKTGGLADVVGALPKALAAQGWDMRVMLPAYRGLREKLGAVKVLSELDDVFGGPGKILHGKIDGIDILLLDAPHLYDRTGGPYGNPSDFIDNPERFAALSFAAAQVAMYGLSDGWKPEVLHAHDWQAGLAPAFVKYAGDTRVKSVITVHNIAFQGVAPSARMGAMRIPGWAFNPGGVEYWGNISTLKAGLVSADAITTVSPTYANELMRSEFGMGLEGVISARAADVTGILNGTDIEVWNPETDPAITPYSAKAMKGKAANRADLIQHFGLGEVPGPLAIVVSRLTGQKGIDLIPEVIPQFLAAGGGLIVLGTGDPALEEAMRNLNRAYPSRVGIHIGYDEALSHRLFAGADAVLVPSRFEPCGLTQMYGLRYGTIPVVAATGGLADTVVTANPAAMAAGAATGITFHPTDAMAFRQALALLCQIHSDPKQWAALQKQAMKADVSWDVSSRAYAALYDRLTT
jgi:starch synthase